MLERLAVPPWYSCGCSLPSLALSASVLHLGRRSAPRALVAASTMIGVIRPPGMRHRDRNIGAAGYLHQLVAGEADVAFGHRDQRLGQRLDQQVVDRQLYAIGFQRLVELAAQLEQRVEPDIDRQVDVRDRSASTSVRRRAMVLRMLDSFSASCGMPKSSAARAAAAAGAARCGGRRSGGGAAAGAGLAAPSTSALTIRPLGPLPVHGLCRSTPFCGGDPLGQRRGDHRGHPFGSCGCGDCSRCGGSGRCRRSWRAAGAAAASELVQQRRSRGAGAALASSSSPASVRDDRADLHAFGAFGHGDRGDHAFVDRFEFHRRLVGLDLGHDVAGRHRVAHLDQPFGQRAFFHGRRKRGHLDVDRHGLAWSSRWASWYHATVSGQIAPRTGKVLAQQYECDRISLTDGGGTMRVYLVIMDETDEAATGACALLRAGRRKTGGTVHLLALVPQQQFVAFGGVQATIEEEARDRAEALVTGAAGNLLSESGQHAGDLGHGRATAMKVIREYLAEHPEVSALVLGAAAERRRPGRW